MDAVQQLIKDLGPVELTSEQERELLLRVPDAMAVQTLVAAHVLIIRRTANRYRGLGLDIEDLVQWALYGFVRGIHRFDTARTTGLSCYALKYARGAILKAVADFGTTVRIPRYGGIGEYAVRAAEHCEDVLLVEPPAKDGAEVRDDLTLAVESLEEPYRAIVTARFGEGLTLADVGAKLGLSPQRVHQLQLVAVAMLREKLCAE